MFGTDKISPDYTFTQSEDRFLKTSLSNALSNHFGSGFVSKSNEVEDLTDKSKYNPSIKSKDSEKTKGKDKLDESDETQGEIVDIFSEEEDNDDSLGILYGGVSSITTSFDALAAAVGASDDRVTKSQLMALLQSLSSDAGNGDKANEIAFVKNLIAKFDTLSGDADYITSFNGVNDPQDYTTVTKEQVTPPVDLRV